jgi:hypothetical protein
MTLCAHGQADWQTVFTHAGRREESSDAGGPTRELFALAAALDEGLPAFCLPHSRLYGESL